MPLSLPFAINLSMNRMPEGVYFYGLKKLRPECSAGFAQDQWAVSTGQGSVCYQCEALGKSQVFQPSH